MLVEAEAPGGVSGRTVIVTGGAGLLGREYASALVRGGANVVLADIDGGGVQAQAAELSTTGGVAVGLCIDVTDEVQVNELVRRSLERFGRIDCLVNNAAIDPKVGRGHECELSVPFERYPVDLWARTLAVNLTGMFLCSREVAPAMLAQRAGVIVNVSSTYGMVGPDQRLYEPERVGDRPMYKPAAYSVSKSGVIGFTRYLAAYYAGRGIRVNTLTLGGVFKSQPEDFVRRYSARTPLGRMASSDEYNSALLFLASDASSYMTGGNLVIDGGWTAW